MLEPPPDVLRVELSARLLDGFAVREGRYFLGGAELEVRYMDNAG